MATKDFSKYKLYRWRYRIGYSLVGILLAVLLVFAGLYLPGGLASYERTSVIQSASLSLSDPKSLAVTSLPYHAFQALIFKIFGVSIFTVKLPSLIIALASAIGLIVLLRRWFKPNVAVFASLIAISTGQFIFLAQLGTPSILYIFWPVALLLLGTQITRVNKLRPLWKILFVVSAALSLYTPLSIYPLLAIALSVAFHPHLRASVKKFRRMYVILSSLVFVVLIAPLVWLVVISPQLGLSLVGVPAEAPSLLTNAFTLVKQYLFFWQTSSGSLMTPVFGLGSAILVLLGLYRLILTRETTRSYLIIFWILCLIPVLLVNPAFTSVTFVPTVMMLAAGFTSLSSYWYRLFPLNPYARVTGLVPIVVLVGALIISGVARYAYGYHYSPSTVVNFSKDLTLLPKDTKTLLVAESEKPFFNAIAKYREELNVVTKPTSSDNLTATRKAKASLVGFDVKRIITSNANKNADRYYIVEKSKPAPAQQ